MVALENKNKERKDEERNQKRKHILDGMESKTQKMGVQYCIDALGKDIENYCNKTEADCNKTLLVKANAIRKTKFHIYELIFQQG